jgi:uncharacterized protein YdeI (BOF family)
MTTVRNRSTCRRRPALTPVVQRWSLMVALACVCSCDGTRDAGAAKSDRDDTRLARADGSWVRVDGTVVTTTDRSFELDYGRGYITVEVDDWDWYKEGRSILPNDEVVVYGRLDKGFYEGRTIEASSVYVEDLGTTFYASSADEEELGPWYVGPVQVGNISIGGTVKSVRGREVVLDTGVGEIIIDTARLGYNPLDNEGFQRIKAGDRIRVLGRIGDSLFGARRIVADQLLSVRIG